MDAKVWRLLDANANRAREGLRVIEDTARFVLNKPAAAKAVRALRHGLDDLVRGHYKTLLAARDVGTDSGRSNAAKPYKGGIGTLLAANFKRSSEALRVLEEYGRILSPGATKRVQALRFKVYEWETKLLSNGLTKHGSTS
jgi:thiamine-phosphate pyrophosphorylase